MLKGIIQQYDINLFGQCYQLFDSMDPFSVNCYSDVRVFLLHLAGFISNLFHGGILSGYPERTGFSLISPAESSNFKLRFQEFYEVFYMRCFTGTADRNVSHRDHRKVKFPGWQYSPIK